MIGKKQNPVALAGAHRAECFEALIHGFDTLSTTPLASENPAVRALSRRLGRPLPTIRAICELAGLGVPSQ